MVVDVALVHCNKDVFVIKTGGDGVSSGEIGGGPFVTVNGGAEGGGVIKLEGEGSLGTGGSRCDEERGEGVEAECFGGGFAGGVKALSMGIEMTQGRGDVERGVFVDEFAGEAGEG